MSDPLQPGVPARVRPSTVTVSSYLLYLTAALILIVGIVSLATVGTTTEVYRDVYRGTEAEGTEGLLVAGSVVGVVLNLLVAAGLVVLALLNNRGKNAARIVTWVVGGLTVCCSGVGLVGQAATSAITLPTQPGMPDAAEVQRRLEDALPGWVTPVSLVLGILQLLALVVALVLLALPASNAFFRKPAAAAGGWEPGMPAYPYPAQPQYPGQEQQPGIAQYPTGSQYPGQAPHPGQPPEAAHQPGPPQYPGQQQQPGTAHYPAGEQYPGQAPPPAEPGSPPPAGDDRRPTDPPPPAAG
ncbi:hypothetical protein [Spirilliplanes yamanashiensis]|uniref:Uncharacterized protein n=1 Tax=Spirilliplanes yamanashiensis TaxID=42233 RepID=A0A8J3Y7J8_9ACTN|nr:hypothetical protein [Spirilliplanes yamanashiensis]MDP9815082.1 hypothetical protein [Spirilliplanes yamanashiensis]GIJ02738.1 hypothetical protein Sya03_20900 [Spirilliplanes yamanashiensis]